MTAASVRDPAAADAPAPRVLELYCGLGGLSAALGPGGRVAAAIDQSDPALAVYRANFPGHPTLCTRVDSLGSDRLAAFQADLWWASPPCQPFTQRGERRGLDDSRAATFLALLRRVETVRPPYFALENVEGFVDSDGHRLLRRVLERAGYGDVREQVLCPSRLGAPNRRPRFYLLAARTGGEDGVTPLAEETYQPGPWPDWQDLLDDEADYEAALRLPADLLARYDGALHVVDRHAPVVLTNCFTSAYGRSPVRSGSFLRMDDGRIRRFAPGEVLRFLGFPASFGLPPGLRRENGWRLAGNSLSLHAVRRVLSAVPGLLRGSFDA